MCSVLHGIIGTRTVMNIKICTFLRKENLIYLHSMCMTMPFIYVILRLQYAHRLRVI